MRKGVRTRIDVSIFQHVLSYRSLFTLLFFSLIARKLLLRHAMDEQDKRQERQSLIKRVLAFVAALALCATLVGSQASVQTWKRPVNTLVSHYQHLVIASGETQTPLNVDDVLGDLPDVGIEVHMPPGEHRATVIYIPGLAQGPGANFVRGTLSSRWPNVKWTTFIPPLRHVDVWHREHGELQSNAWFDMKSFPYDYAHDHDTKSFAESAVQIHRVIKKEIDELVRSMRSLQDEPVNNDEITAEERQAAAKRIALGGFSQGAAMTLLAGLTLDYELGGLFPLSGFLPLRRAIPFVRLLTRCIVKTKH